jgi:hypothetical protein
VGAGVHGEDQITGGRKFMISVRERSRASGGRAEPEADEITAEAARAFTPGVEIGAAGRA